jgi:outer membrane protein
MMQKRIRALGLAAALLVVSGFAQADVKIAAVRMEVMQNSPQIKALQAQLQAEVDKRRTTIEAQKKQFADDVQKFQRDQATMSPDQHDKTEKELSTRQAQIDYDQRKAEAELQAKGQELQGAAFGRIKDVIYQVAKEKGYDLVVTDALVVNPAVDITDEVVKRMSAAGGK